jgi:hypothetical protein
MSIKKIEIKEKDELEPIIVRNPDLIEDGLKIVAHQLMTPTGPLDILAVDENGVLAIIELKNEVDKEEHQLIQCLRYYDWCYDNKAWIATAYKELAIDPHKEPRIILVAPDFSESLKRLAKFINIEPELFRYQAVELQDGERTIICTQTFFEERLESPVISTLPKSIIRIKNESTRSLYDNCLNKLKELHFDLQPRANDTVSGYFNGKRILRIYPKNDFFSFRLQMEDLTWSNRIRITSNNDWDEFYEKYLRERMDENELNTT